MDSYPRGAQVDYEKMVQNVVQKVFYEHVSLFKFGDEDEPLASELFTLGFDMDSEGPGQAQNHNHHSVPNTNGGSSRSPVEGQNRAQSQVPGRWNTDTTEGAVRPPNGNAPRWSRGPGNS